MTTIEAKPLAWTDRRQWSRALLHLPVHLVDTDGSFSVVSGETLDIGVGGMRARVDGPFSGSVEATVRIDLSDGRAMLCEALVAGGGATATGWEYRLAFRNLDPADAATLEELVRSAA